MNRTLGLIGGTSWVSTIDYYRLINEGVTARLGGNQSASCLIHSFNFGTIQELVFRQDWDAFFTVVAAAAENLVRSGAEAIVLCANTKHVVADRLAARIQVPIIHIVDATAERIAAAGLDRVALLGTRFTMEMDFFRDRLAQQGIVSSIPGDDDREFIHRTIFGELGSGIFSASTKARYVSIMEQLGTAGAQGVILGCTEIPLLIKPGDTAMPLFDTTAIHSAAAVEFATT
jgi:aspartate racemase